jgi:CDP-diacylglycerol--glycerol-3-phosphate 3-phosphatidyltransferase
MTERVSERAVRRLPAFGLGWPNVVSIVRILLIPVIAVLLVQRTDASSWVAVGLYAVGAFSDGLDGYLARRHGMTTATGAWLDPLSDKIYVIVPAAVLSWLGEFPWWGTVVIAVREIAVTILRWRLDARGGVSMPASFPAKAKTVTQLSAVGLAMMPLPSAWDPVVTAVVVVAVGLTVYTGGEYFLTTRHRVRAAIGGEPRVPR